MCLPSFLFACGSVVKMTIERLHLLILVVPIVIGNGARQSCDESLLNKNGKLSKADVSDLISGDNQAQIKMCLSVLGKDPLDREISELLWKDLVKVSRWCVLWKNFILFFDWLLNSLKKNINQLILQKNN